MSGIEILAFGRPAGDAFAVAAGIAAALILLVGPILLRFQRQRHQFLLTRAALERGVTTLPSGPPAWLQSARTGVVLLTVGVSVFVCGLVSVDLSRGAKMPEQAVATTQPTPTQRENQGPPFIGGMGHGPHDHWPMGHGLDGRGMEGRGMEGHGIEAHGMGQQFEGPAGVGDCEIMSPMMLDPVTERWHQAQAQRGIGLTALASGFILSVMGISRLLFSRVERRYEPIVDETPVK